MKYYKIPEKTLCLLIKNVLFVKAHEEYFNSMEVLAFEINYLEEHGGMESLINEYLDKFKECEME